MQTCNNLPGTFFCSCETGYIPSGSNCIGKNYSSRNKQIDRPLYKCTLLQMLFLFLNQSLCCWYSKEPPKKKNIKTGG